MVGIGELVTSAAADVRARFHEVARAYFTTFLHVRLPKSLAFYMVFYSLLSLKPRILHGILWPLLLKTSYFMWYSIAFAAQNLVFYT